MKRSQITLLNRNLDPLAITTYDEIVQLNFRLDGIFDFQLRRERGVNDHEHTIASISLSTFHMMKLIEHFNREYLSMRELSVKYHYFSFVQKEAKRLISEVHSLVDEAVDANYTSIPHSNDVHSINLSDADAVFDFHEMIDNAISWEFVSIDESASQHLDRIHILTSIQDILNRHENCIEKLTSILQLIIDQ